MLTLPLDNRPYRIMGIDPGTDTFGVAVVDLDLVSNKPAIIYTETLRGARGARQHPEIEAMFGTRQAKFYSNKLALSKLMGYFDPTIVISESPYMGKFPQAFEALIQCLTMIQSALTSHDPSMVLETIDPPNVKKAVGASGRSKKGGEKELVKDALLVLPNLTNLTNKRLDHLDEHSIDAIAVACFKLKTILPEIFKKDGV